MLSFLTLLLLAAVPPQGPGGRPAPPAAAKPAPAPAPLISWSATRPLTAADYLGRPAPGERLAGLTSTNIKAGAACRDFVFSGTVQATFDPNTSWFRDAKNAPATLLRHEQLHFDLTEVYARVMRQRMVTFQARANCLKLQPAFNNFTKLVYAEWDREQNRYDQDTNHGLNAPRQAFWEKQIQLRLEQLKAFAEQP